MRDDSLMRSMLVLFMFWPWVIGFGEFLFWFFHFSPIFVWEIERILAAALYPIPAALTIWALLWMIGS